MSSLRKLFLSTVAFALVTISVSAQSSPWTLPKDANQLTAELSWQTATHFWYGANHGTLPGPLRQASTILAYQHGISDSLTMDVSGGIVRTYFLGHEEGGLSDTSIGITKRLLDEFHSDSPYAFTLSARLGVVIEGTYPIGNFTAAGDGASGVEFGLSAGKFLPGNAGVYLDLDFRHNAESVPNEYLYAIGYFRSVTKWLSLGIGGSGQYIRHGGPDIFSANFTGHDFPAVREIYHRIEASATFQLTPTTSLTLNGARVYWGRNTPRKTIINSSVTWSF